MDRLKNLASVEEEEDDDEEDEDYDPTKDDLENDDDADKDGGEDDSDESGDDDDSDGEDGSKREKKSSKKRGRKRKACSSIDNAENVSGESKTDLTVDEKKKKADDLWAELNDSSSPQPKPLIATKESNEEKVFEKVYDFAGEKVVVKETPKTITSSSTSSTSSDAPSAAPSGVPTMRRSGLKDLVSNLGKKNKLGTLMKSKYDWDTFKREQGIEDELKRATLNKDGYVERQAFLSRADVRQFEIERSIRSKVRKPQ